jgi:hypothetical protein
MNIRVKTAWLVAALLLAPVHQGWAAKSHNNPVASVKVYKRGEGRQVKPSVRANAVNKKMKVPMDKGREP